ncbi:MAG: glycosyltransferase family 4 protein [Lachnospiraceae bacterium]|nr:glycosyltransferase family 4 protein [Lachnospiraceae bacterium]
MKILFITHYDNMYGANKALFHLALLLKTKYGEEPVMVVPAEGGMTERLMEAGIQVIIHPITQWQAVYSTPLRFLVKKIRRKKRLIQEVDSLFQKLCDEDHFGQKPDVIYSNSSVIGTGAMLAEKLRCRHIWHIREFSWEHFHMKYFYPEKRVCELYEHSECLVTISDALKNNYQQRYPNARIRRIYDGVSGEYPVKREEPAERPLRFCYIGYLFPMKHQEQILDACERLNREGLTEYEVYLVGDGREGYCEKLKKKILKAGLSQVKMTGYRMDVHELLDTMDVGLIASEYEGFGLVTVEYMLHGMPVIGRNSGGTPEIIRDQVTGYLYDDTEGLVNAMKRLMQHPEKIKQMGKEGAERARECFSEERNAEEIACLIHEDHKSVG